MQKLTLLCVDDDPVMAEMIYVLASEAQFTARTVSYRNFPHVYARFPADALVINIFRLEHEGAQLLTFLSRRTIAAPLILITGTVDNDKLRALELARQLNLSCHAHVYKPFAPEALQEVLFSLNQTLYLDASARCSA